MAGSRVRFSIGTATAIGVLILWTGACSGTNSSTDKPSGAAGSGASGANPGSGAGGAANSTSSAGAPSGGSIGISGTGGATLCGGALCSSDEICCGPSECGHRINKLSKQACPGTCAGGAGGTPGAGGAGGAPSVGGAAGTPGGAGVGGLVGMSGSTSGGTSGRGGAAAQGGSGGSAQGASCTLGGTDCPTGFHCGCGGPGPGPGACTCHKECTTESDCAAPNPMCGCSVNDAAPRMCVNACFCSCG